MSDSISDNKRIAKNTVLLYIRMILVMAVGLYTSRVVLSVLGVDDYGLYNVVGGVVATMTFLNSALAAASQRFISYELGRGNLSVLKDVFSTSVTVHAILAIICVVVFESVGVWFLNNRLNVSSDRLYAANWVFQCSILTFVLNVLNVPYNATIVAHEKMGAYAYISIFETVLKLSIVYILFIADFDKLILYAILHLTVALIIRFCYVGYCRSHFRECHYRFIFDKTLFRRIFSFAGWSVVGNIGFTLKDPLSNIVLNLFFGTTVNAARGIAMQVNSIVSSFAGNFGMAVNPQIVKRYASGDIKGSADLVYTGARLSFFLIVILSVPVLANINPVLELWLVEVPEYTDIFFILTMISSLIYSLSGTTSVAVQATGNIKWFSIGVCIIPVLEVPIAYLLLKSGLPPYSALVPAIFLNLLALFFRFFILKSIEKSYSWIYYIINVVLRSFITFAICLIPCIFIGRFIHGSLLSLILSLTLCFLLCGMVVYWVGMTNVERHFVNERVCVFLKLKKR